MSLGAAKALGLLQQALAASVVNITYTKPSYTRHLYAGGPSIAVNRKAATGKRFSPYVRSRTKSSKFITVKGTDSQERIHYTGKLHAFVAWMNQYANGVANGDVYELIGSHGQSLTVATLASLTAAPP